MFDFNNIEILERISNNDIVNLLLNIGVKWVRIILFVFIIFVCIIVDIGVGVVIDLINYWWKGNCVVGIMIVNISSIFVNNDYVGCVICCDICYLLVVI